MASVASNCLDMLSDMSTPDSFSSELLRLHNKRREEHGAPPLRWSDELSQKAQKWADRLASLAHLSYCELSGIGENITFFPPDVDPQMIVDHWYSEQVKYDYEAPGWQPGTNYFTQVIWKATKEIGVGRAIVAEKYIQPPSRKNCTCNGVIAEVGALVVVAFYRPAGNSNRAGQFAVNVHEPIHNES